MSEKTHAIPTGVFEREETVVAWDDDYYHPVSEKYYDRAIRGMLTAMGAKENDLVLDAGCGPGVHSIRAARFGARVRAIDLSNAMLRHARERAEKAGVADRIEFSQGDLTRLALPSGVFPFVFNWGVLIHVPDAERALDSLARVLAPGGKLALHIVMERSLDDLIERFARKLLGKPLENETRTDLGTGSWYDFNGERLWVQRFNFEKLRSGLERRGLKFASRRGAEFSELQRRVPRAARPALLMWNRIAYALRLPASLFCTQILVFEQTRDPRADPLS